MSDLIETGDAMRQLAVSRHSGAGTLIFSNLSEDDPRFIRGSATVSITAVITGFHIEYPMVPEESGPGRRPYVLVNAQIESIRGPIGGLNRNLVFADFDTQKFTFYYPISDEELRNMIYDGLFKYKTFADTLAAHMKDDFREVTFSCDLDYTLFMPLSEREYAEFINAEDKEAALRDVSVKQILVCDPVSIFHDRSFLEPAVDFIPPSIQDNENIHSLSFRLDEASETVGKICAETDQEQRSVLNPNEVQIRVLDDKLIDNFFTPEEMADIWGVLNEDSDDFVDDYVPEDATLFRDEEEEKRPDLGEGKPLFEFEEMAEEPVADDLLEEDEPEENVPDVPDIQESKHSPIASDTMIFAKGTELSDSVKMTEEMKKEEQDVLSEEEMKKAQADADIDALFEKFDKEAATEAEEKEKLSKKTVAMPKPVMDASAIQAGQEDLQQKVEDTGLYTDEDENEDSLYITDN